MHNNHIGGRFTSIGNHEISGRNIEIIAQEGLCNCRNFDSKYIFVSSID